MACNLGSLAKQLAAATESIRNDPAVLDKAENERAELIRAAEALLTTIKPADPMLEGHMAMVQFTVVRLFVGWKVFEAIPLEGSILYSDLAAAVQAEALLLVRLSRMLIATGLLRQVGADGVAHTASSAKFATPSPLCSLVRMAFDDTLKSLQSMPRYFDQFGRKEHFGKYGTISAFADGDPSLTVWQHINRDPERLSRFMDSMVAMASRMPMTGSYDFGWVVEKMGRDPDRVLVVDVGGGQGHALREMAQATKGLPLSRCVLEDLEEVVEEAKSRATGEMSQVQYVPVDFHSQQPIKGACVYYIRRCLHDYGDKDCIDILQQIRQAMAKDSRLLIVDQVLTDPPQPLASAVDIVMATIGGKERDEDGFKAITSQAGLRIIKMHASPGSDVAVIECEKVDGLE
ncbi:hypothetical protein RJ55_03388 [Drechmeria coniospora]|nr:hypothetical protein RJ55_03388 [Drechmeria coniospora]